MIDWNGDGSIDSVDVGISIALHQKPEATHINLSGYPFSLCRSWTQSVMQRAKSGSFFHICFIQKNKARCFINMGVVRFVGFPFQINGSSAAAYMRCLMITISFTLDKPLTLANDIMWAMVSLPQSTAMRVGRVPTAKSMG